ncbi:hypothetical protein ACG2F4_06355 [Halalkalibaculum sp. DA3122]|uniref:hypothetical protein n=1 Tax=unclassified Halalkalibaculum TaxID=2964617 RepID=UPI003753F31B
MEVLVRHKVEDFVRWREVFESHKNAQREAGMQLKKLWRNVDEPDEVILLFDVDDPEQAREFLYSADIPDAKNGSGVIDDPDIYFLE